MRTIGTLLISSLLLTTGCGQDKAAIAISSNDDIASFCEGWQPNLFTTTAGDRVDCGSGSFVNAHRGFTEEQCNATLQALRDDGCNASLADFAECDEASAEDTCATYVRKESPACNRLWACDEPNVSD